jgi:hypothetical protein
MELQTVSRARTPRKTYLRKMVNTLGDASRRRRYKIRVGSHSRLDAFSRMRLWPP